MSFKIEKDVPLPEGKVFTRYSFGSMEIGDSVLFTHEEAANARFAAARYGKRNGKKFTTRTVEGGLRIWRVK